MKVVWQPQAQALLFEVFDYIERRNPQSAYDLLAKTVHIVEQLLPENPGMGRGIGGGLRELVVHSNYIVTYRVTDTEIQIPAIRHGTRR